LEKTVEFAIRPGTEKDLPAMLQLWREMMDFHARLEPRFRPLSAPAGEQAWAKFVSDDVFGKKDWCILVAESRGELVGQIIGLVRDQYPVFEPELFGYVSDIVVHPRARRNGIGQALFDALVAWFRERRARHIELRVAHNNPASQAFWRAVGCTDYMDTLWYELEGE
jgi:ribosomal protein S18 acetylase RimI-like enzyme